MTRVPAGTAGVERHAEDGAVGIQVFDDYAALDGAVFACGISRCVTAGTTAADQPAYATTPGAEAPAFTAAIDEPRATDGWFDGGVLTWETGDNARPGDRGDALAARRRASSRCGPPPPTPPCVRVSTRRFGG